MKIAIQGELGSFSHQAALRAIPNATVVPCVLSPDAFDRLRKGKVDAIMIPIENTLAGSVVEHYDLLREHSVFIESETVIRIEHHVIGIAGSDIAEVQRTWEAFAKAEAERIAKGWTGGTGYPTVYHTALKVLTRDRVKQLRSWLQEMFDDTDEGGRPRPAGN